MIVADTNLVAYLLIPGDQTDASELVFQSDPTWVAPLLWRSELRNVLALYMRRQGMTLAQAVATMEQGEQLLAAGEYAVPSDLVLELVAETSLSAYDAEFVVLAQSLRVPLVTADAKVLKAVPDVAVSPRQLSSSS